MAIHKAQAPYDQPQRTKIVIIESERGWGSKVDEVLWADTPKEADDYIAMYNVSNPPGPAPDWYMIARRG